MNEYGSAVYKLSWEPWSVDLPHRLAVRLIRNPGYIYPIWDHLVPWKMLECWFGYEIPHKVAEAQYGIDGLGNRNALYMEHWTTEGYRIAVNDKVVTRKLNGQTYRMEGVNPWGMVPFFLVPHERTKDTIFGESMIPRQEDLTKEINARSADVADTVRSIRPGIYTSCDVDSFSTRSVSIDGVRMMRVVDLGHKRPVPNSGEPTLEPLQVPDVSDRLLDYPKDLVDFWMMTCRVSPAIFGLDDTRSGRITGPAIAQRMWTSLSHVTTERINFSETKSDLDKAILIFLDIKREALGEIGVVLPEYSRDQIWNLDIQQTWPPSIPLERQDVHMELIQRLQEGGISIEAYLREMGVTDVENEKEKILEWMKRLEEMEAKAKALAQPKQEGKDVDSNKRVGQADGAGGDGDQAP